MKLIIISHYPPIPGGISKYTKRTVDLLRKNNIEVDVIPIHSINDCMGIFLKIKKYNADIVRVEFAISMYRELSILVLLQVFMSKWILGKKIVANFHEVVRDTQMLKYLGILFYRIISKPFNLISVHTNEAKKVLIDYCHINNKKVTVYPHGLYVSKSPHLEPNYSKETRVILFFGYIHIHKGIEYLIEAYSLLHKNAPALSRYTKLVICGSIRERSGIFKIFQKKDNSYYTDLVNKIEKLRLKDSVSLLGYVADEKLNELIHSAYVIVLPYTSTEQSGVLNQSIPACKPIIASNIGGLGETLKNTGILVKPKNSNEIYLQIRKLLEDKTYYMTVQNKYQILNEDLDPNKIVKEQVKEYVSLLKH